MKARIITVPMEEEPFSMPIHILMSMEDDELAEYLRTGEYEEPIGRLIKLIGPLAEKNEAWGSLQHRLRTVERVILAHKTRQGIKDRGMFGATDRESISSIIEDISNLLESVPGEIAIELRKVVKELSTLLSVNGNENPPKKD